MVSATDIITYIGVPPAVLGVSPIFHTFTVALYTSLKLQHFLRTNSIEPRIRARMMTGVVEVDLPVFQLYTLDRQEAQYWLPSASLKTIGGASWSICNFESREIDVVTCRLQRSDKIILPEAKVDFNNLLDFPLDLGCYPDLNGFHVLRTRGQNTAGASLMCIRETQVHGQSSRTILEVAKPGDRHGLISLRLANLWSSEKSLLVDDMSKRLPQFSLTGPLLQSQHDVARTETDNVASTPPPPNTSITSGSASVSTEKRCHFVISMIGELGMQVSIHEAPIPSQGTELSSDHMKLLNLDLASAEPERG